MSLWQRKILYFLLLLATSIAGNVEARPKQKYDLVPPLACLAGGITGEPGALEWRLQFGVFEDEGGALTLQKRLERKGIRTTHYMAAWLARDEQEPQVVVSTKVFPDAATARQAAQKLREKGVKVLVRQFRATRLTRSSAQDS